MAKISNLHDRFSKEILSRVEIAADFLANYLPPEVAAALDLADLKLVKGSFVDSDLKEYFSDLLYRVRLGRKRDALVYVLLEHKSAPDEWVAFQLLRYMVKIWEPMARKRDRRLPPIIPVVLYHGRRQWRIARNFQALIELDESGVLSANVPDFEYGLCDLTEYDADKLGGGVRLRLAMLAMKNVFRADQRGRLAELVRVIRGLRAEDKDGLEYVVTVLGYYSAAAKGLGKKDFSAAVREALPGEEGIMSTVAEEWIKEGIKKGRKEGREEGTQKGTADLTLRQLQRRLGRVSGAVRARILRLPAAELQELGIALLDFNSQRDLSTWLAKRN